MCEVRQVGDFVLHQPVKKLPALDKLHDTLMIMQNLLTHYGGVGIAANQCLAIEEPYAVMVVGVNDVRLQEKIKLRYPNEVIPASIVLCNPVIKKLSDDTYYPTHGEGCLSVIGPLRGRVLRHRSVEVEYFNENGKQMRHVFTEFAAHIIQHEYDHLSGIVYLERIFKDMTVDDRRKFLNLVKKELSTRNESHSILMSINDMLTSSPMLGFDRDETGVLKIDWEKICAAFTMMPKETLDGILIRF
jgi:peptide deformylase